jgi:hypothetical protein
MGLYFTQSSGAGQIRSMSIGWQSGRTSMSGMYEFLDRTDQWLPEAEYCHRVLSVLKFIYWRIFQQEGHLAVTKSLLALGGIVVITLTLSSPLGATELPMPSINYAGIAPPVYCGPCGCLSVAYNYHPELRSTYGLSFDPRNYDTTQPHYYFGRVRAYPRYYVDGVPTYGSC